MMANREGSKARTENRLTSRLGCNTQSFRARSEDCLRSGLGRPFPTMRDSDRLGLIASSQRRSTKLFARLRTSHQSHFAMNLWVSMEDEGDLTSTVAAGGIGDARGIVAAFALGAEGVQMGTAFLACEESGAAILSGQAKQTGLTRGFTGRLARGIKNRLLDELNQKDIEILPYPLQRALVRHLSITAEQAGRPRVASSLGGTECQPIAVYGCARTVRHAGERSG
jgi:hypothetical protein